jgi:glycosyltransferase involved in cell wall biosynthesis
VADLLVAARNYPPASGGTAFLLYELLKHWPSDAAEAVCGAMYFQGTSDQRLPFPAREVLVARSRYLTPRLVKRAPRSYTALVRRAIRRAARRAGATRIYAHYPDATFLVAAYQAAEDLDLPLAVYFDILWEERGENVDLAREFEHRIVERADIRVAITETAAAHLTAKHGHPFEVIPHVMDPPEEDPAEDGPPPDEAVLHFAGGVYGRMNQDSVVRAARVVMSSSAAARFEIYGPELEDVLPEDVLGHEKIRCGWAKRTEIEDIQRRSSVLLLPQAFESSTPEMIRCNFPTKALEYMRAGRPILVHSPPESYLTKVAREYDFGVVVDEPDERQLREGLERLLDDAEVRRRCVDGGRRFLAEREARPWARKLYERLTG